MTIRSYGLGKFYTILDSLVYSASLDGGADEEASYGEGAGWYGLMRDGKGIAEWIDASKEIHEETLTPEEREMLETSAGVILFERSDWIVESTWFDTEKEMEK